MKLSGSDSVRQNRQTRLERSGAGLFSMFSCLPSAQTPTKTRTHASLTSLYPRFLSIVVCPALNALCQNNRDKNVSLINRNSKKQRRASVSVAVRTANERDEEYTAMALLWRSENSFSLRGVFRVSRTRTASAFAHQRHHPLPLRTANCCVDNIVRFYSTRRSTVGIVKHFHFRNPFIPYK